MTSGPCCTQEDIAPAWSPIGTLIAFVRMMTPAGSPSVSHIYITRPSGLATRQLTFGPDSDRDPAFSPSGDRVIFARDGNVWSVSSGGGTAVRLTDLPPGSVVEGPTFSGDGARIVFSAHLGDSSYPGQPLYEMTAGGGSIHQISPTDAFDAFYLTPDERNEFLNGQPTGNAVAGELAFARPIGPEGALSIYDRVTGNSLSYDFRPSDPDTPMSGSPFGVWPRWTPIRGVSSEARFAYISTDARNSDVHIYNGHNVNYDAPPTSDERVTWDTALKDGLSWASATTPPDRANLGSAGIIRPPHAGSTKFIAFVHCPSGVGGHGCKDVVTLFGAGHVSLASHHLRLAAGRTRQITMGINRGARQLLFPGLHLRLTLRQRARAHTTTRSFNAPRVELASALTTSCPSSVQAGSVLGLHGRLSAASSSTNTVASAASNGAASHRKLSVVAVGSSGEILVVRVKTDRHGRFSASVKPTHSGRWSIQVIWAGDHLHGATDGRRCGMTVPAISTSLTLTCPGKGTVGTPMTSSGTLTPRFAGANVVVTYENKKSKSAAVTRVANTDSTGQYSDTFTPDSSGDWIVRAAFAGDARHGPSSSAPCTSVVG